MLNLEKWYWWTYLQGRSGDIDVENRLVDTVGEGEDGIIEKVALTCTHSGIKLWLIHNVVQQKPTHYKAITLQLKLKIKKLNWTEKRYMHHYVNHRIIYKKQDMEAT